MFNVGVSWIPTEGVLEGLSMDVDYYNYRYEDLISREVIKTSLIRIMLCVAPMA